MSLDLRSRIRKDSSIAPVDKFLTQRIQQALNYSLVLRENKFENNSTYVRFLPCVNHTSTISPCQSSGGAADVVLRRTEEIIRISSLELWGPRIDSLSSFCKKLPISVFRELIGADRNTFCY